MSAVLDNLEAATAKRVGPSMLGVIYADDLVTYLTDPRPEIDAMKFGQPIAPVIKRPAAPGTAAGRPRVGKPPDLLKIRVPPELKASLKGVPKLPLPQSNDEADDY